MAQGPTEPALTASQVNRAAHVLRRALRSELDPDDPQVERALDIVLDYRASFRRPLVKATNGLRSVVRSEGCTVEVSQRLKRMATILDKLQRQPSMALAQMQDVAGCRAVLASIDEVYRVKRRLAKNRPPLRENDYIAQPRLSGYRGVHVIIQYDERCIEVQLRTRVMHEWAATVERLGGRIGEDLKSGRGPQQVLDLLEAISEAMAIEEQGRTVDTTLISRIAELNRAALPFMQGESGESSRRP